MDLRKQARLHLLGNFQFLGGASFGFELLGEGAAAGFDSRRASTPKVSSSKPARPKEFPSTSSKRVKVPPHAGFCGADWK